MMFDTSENEELDIPSGIPHKRDLELPQNLHNVLPKPRILVNKAVLILWVIYPAIDASAHMLGEARIDTGIDLVDDARGVDVDARR